MLTRLPSLLPASVLAASPALDPPWDPPAARRRPPPSMLPAPSSSSFNTAADRHLAVPPWEAYHHAGPSSASSSRSSFDSRGAAPAFLSLPSTPTDSSFYNEPASSRMATEILGDYDEDEADFDDDDDSAMEDDVVPADHPSRFEQRSTPDGQVFYVDHHLKITSWELCVPLTLALSAQPAPGSHGTPGLTFACSRVSPLQAQAAPADAPAQGQVRARAGPRARAGRRPAGRARPRVPAPRAQGRHVRVELRGHRPQSARRPARGLSLSLHGRRRLTVC